MKLLLPLDSAHQIRGRDISPKSIAGSHPTRRNENRSQFQLVHPYCTLYPMMILIKHLPSVLTLGKIFLIMSGETALIGLASSSSTEAVIALSLILAFFQGSE